MIEKSSVRHSVIVPIYNDEEAVGPFYTELSKSFEAIKESFEVIFVDDASQDRTFERLSALRARDPRVCIIRMSRNFGHQVSLLAGMDYARGDTLITMDGDLQHPPALLQRLIEGYRQGYDVVYTVRTNSPHEGFFAPLLSRMFYRIFNGVTSLGVDPGIADFRLMSRRAADVFCSLREMHRFNRGLVGWIGFRQLAVPYEAPGRIAGYSKFSFKKRLRLAFDGLFSFSVLPLRFCALLGFGLSSVSLAYALWLMGAKVLGHPWPPGLATLAVAVMFFGGLQLFFLGVMGEYMGRIYQESKHRPLYIVDQALGLEDRKTKA